MDRPGPGPSARVPGALRWLPVLAACAIALVEVLTLGGVYVSDTAQFLRETLHVTPLRSDHHHVIPPAYPLFLDVVCLAPASVRMILVVLVQQASVVGAVYLVLRIGEVLDRPWAGWSAAWLAALYLPFGLLAQTAQTETLFIFFCIASSFLLLNGLVRGRTALVLAAGAVAGLAIAQRTVGAVLPCVVLAAVWLSAGPGRLRGSAAFLLGCGAVVGLFVVKNHHQFGHANLVSGTGIHLFGRVAMVERAAPETPELALLREVARGEGQELFHQNAGWTWSVALVAKHGYTPRDADALLRTVALQSFLDDPWRTVRLTLGCMSSIAAPADPLADSLGGNGALGPALRPEGFHAFFEQIRSIWELYPDHFDRMVALLPPYPPPVLLGEWPFPLIETWAELGQVWRGDWSLVAMAVAAVLGLLLRSRAVLLFSGLALGLLVASAGDQPMPRYFEPSVIPFLLALLLAPAEAAARLRAAGQEEAGIDHEAERGAAVEPEIGPSPDPGTGS